MIFLLKHIQTSILLGFSYIFLWFSHSNLHFWGFPNHVPSESEANCIGLVKLMGRHCGFIAMNAALAARDVDICHLALKIALTSGDLMGFKVNIFHINI